jgi:hypothetical protein
MQDDITSHSAEKSKKLAPTPEIDHFAEYQRQLVMGISIKFGSMTHMFQQYYYTSHGNNRL